MKRILRKGLRWLLIAAVLVAISPFALRLGAALAYRGSTYTIEAAPEAPVAMVFGARVYPSGRLSAMLADRVAAGADLYHAGKVSKLLMTGDGSPGDPTSGYNEPAAMRHRAIELGVPPEDIVLDYAGQRTYDSCYRARTIFGVDQAILVTQNFHLDRALLTCNALGVRSVGVFADYQRPWGYSQLSLNYSRTREFPAILVAALDVIRREPPEVLGPPTPIFHGPEPMTGD